MDVIHCIGNSHVWIFNGEDDSHFPPTRQVLPYFKTYHIGPVIAYNFVEHHLPRVVQELRAHGVAPGSKVMLCVGEVDCRWHLPYQCQQQGRSAKDIVKPCLDRYFRSFLLLKEQGYEMYAWAAHPSTDHGHMDPPGTDTVGPVFGLQQLRNNITVQWNSYLEQLCLKHGVKFVSIYRHLVDGKNVTKMEYLRDYCHLSHKCVPFILKELGLPDVSMDQKDVFETTSGVAAGNST